MTPNDVYNKLLQVGEEWADLDGKACSLEETRKVLLSQIALTHIERGETSAKAETRALADQVYVEHIDAMVCARTEANKARARLDAARAWFDAWRTQESTKRAEMHMAGAA